MATLRKNKKLHRTILKGMRPVEVQSDAGIYLGRRTAFLFPVDVYEGVMERTARGLYYYHFGEILGARIRCCRIPIQSSDRCSTQLSLGLSVL